MKTVDIGSLADDEYQRFTLEGSLYTGVATEHYPAGSLRSEVHIVDGVQEGPAREWYADGQIASDESFRGGGLSGQCKSWHQNGRVAEEATFELGICLERNRWDDEGCLILEYRLESDPSDFNYVVLEARRDAERRGLAEGLRGRDSSTASEEPGQKS